MSSDVDIAEARTRIQAAYDPELMRDAGHRMADCLANHLATVEQSGDQVLPWCHPSDNISRADQTLDQASSSLDREVLADRFGGLIQTMLRHGHNLHDPRYIGHQVPAPVPLGGLFDAVGSVTNQCMATYDMGPWATAVEWALIDRLGQQIGWNSGEFSGLVTHGGSLANLTALLTARNVALTESWDRGVVREAAPPVIVVHSDAHYCVARAAGVVGLGTNHVVRIGLDERRRMDPNQLDKTLRDLRTTNQSIVAVVACACATPIGAFDPLEDIVDICRRHGVWLHVDAAHGGAASFSRRYRHLLAGLDRADSLIWDAHKMLFVPALCAFVLYRDKDHKFETFRQDAPYLFDPAAPGLAEYDSALRTVECTKRAAAIGLWGVWSMFGAGIFGDLVDVTFGMGKILFDKLSAAPDFEPLHEPQCNILVFRHVPEKLRHAEPDRLGSFQFELRRKVIESGESYIVSTSIDGVGALRATIINPLTTPDHLDQLMDTIRATASQLFDEQG